MPSNDVFASLDDALQASASKPSMYFARLATPVIPSLALREGDKAQALTLRLLEKHRKIMDPPQHDSLHHGYELLVNYRKNIKGGFFRAMKHREEIYQYRKGSLNLNYSTATSSLEARSKVLWKKAKSAPSTTSLTSTIDSTALSGVDSVLNDAESFLSAVDSLLNDDGNNDQSTSMCTPRLSAAVA
ncbi:uncharacterized protein B0H18DRAFT_612899 [Fomitopsis serialis]|uniref:uncharacterized protein n=1 Tax=Fomitopsis serialis TaxID=139415 RepID=UPI0020085F54|nr:uncharacterized protein B0H18DRAFT_612899 [Neoantrodia serialis]KAH9920141.1 hypothetical protein B0H18DRAFT_612899 [Neoantrodia serialis]